MSTPKKSDKIIKRLEDLFENETRYGIIMAIRNFGSMNIKILSKIMGKTESTIFHHINELLKEPKIIEIDNDKTISTRGIFYKLSKITEKRYPKSSDAVFEEDIPTIFERVSKLNSEELSKMMMLRMLNQPDLGEMSKKVRRSMSYFHNIENFIINSFERSEQALLKGLKPKNLNYPFGSHSLLSMDLKVFKPEHVIDIAIATSEFFAKIAKLKKKFEEEIKKETIAEEQQIDVIYYLFGGEISEFEFEEDSNWNYEEYTADIVEKLQKIYEGIEE